MKQWIEMYTDKHEWKDNYMKMVQVKKLLLIPNYDTKCEHYSEVKVNM